MGKKDNTNYKYDFDEVKLWQLPYGTIVELDRDHLREVCPDLESFKMSQEKYRFMILGRSTTSFSDEMRVLNIDNGDVEYLPVSIIKDKDFKIYPLKFIFKQDSIEKLENLIEFYTLQSTTLAIDSDFDEYEKSIEALEKLVNVYNIVKSIKQDR